MSPEVHHTALVVESLSHSDLIRFMGSLLPLLDAVVCAVDRITRLGGGWGDGNARAAQSSLDLVNEGMLGLPNHGFDQRSKLLAQLVHAQPVGEGQVALSVGVVVRDDEEVAAKKILTAL